MIEPIKAIRNWLKKKLNSDNKLPGELPAPRNPGLRLEAFDWCCEQSRFSTVGQGTDVIVFWTVIYRGEYRDE